MTVLLWVLLVLSLVCTLAVVIGMIYAAADGKVTNLDYLLLALGVVTIGLDVIGGTAGVVLVTVVLDDLDHRILAAVLGFVPVVVGAWLGGLALVSRLMGLFGKTG